MKLEEKKNRSLTYILPLILKDIPINKDGIINTYIYNINELDLNKHLIDGLFIECSYKYISPNDFKYNTRCKYIRDINESKFLTYLQIPIEYLKDIQQILDSKYSKISDNGKKLILSFWNFGSNNKVYHVLTKSKKLKETLEEALDVNLENVELGEFFDIKKEVYSIDLDKDLDGNE